LIGSSDIPAVITVVAQDGHQTVVAAGDAEIESSPPHGGSSSSAAKLPLEFAPGGLASGDERLPVQSGWPTPTNRDIAQALFVTPRRPRFTSATSIAARDPVAPRTATCARRP
jgi:hypothetical protein